MFKHKFQNIEMISNKKYVSSRKIIIFFYGLGCTSNDVEFLLKRKLLSRFQLIIVDLPGHNNQKYNSENLTIFSRKIYLFLLKKNIKDIIFFGHSIGGIIPILLMKTFLRNKIKVKRFINYEGNLTEADTETLTKKTISYDREEFVLKKYDALLNKSEQSNDDYIKQWSKSLKKTSSYAFYDFSSECVKLSNSNELLKYFRSSVKKKVYLSGEKTNIKEPECFYGSIRFKIKNCGHFSYFENKREFGRVFEQLILKKI